MKLLKNIIGLIHGIRPFYLSRLIFCLSSFYELTAKVGNKMPQILEPNTAKVRNKKLTLLLSFGISILEFLLVLFGIGIIDSCLDGLYFYVPLLLIKIDYILLLLLFVIVVGLIPSISAIVKSITKKPIKVINSED